MNSINRLLSFLVLVLLFVAPASGQRHQIRIACIGGSTTYGDKMQSREYNAYPAQLQAMLGNQYRVLNLGVSEVESTSGKDIFSKGIKNLLNYNPDIIFFLPSAVGDSNEFSSQSVSAMVSQLQSRSSNARIVLLLPPPAWNKDSSESVVAFTKQVLIPSLQDASYKSGCEIIDLNSYFQCVLKILGSLRIDSRKGKLIPDCKKTNQANNKNR